MTNRIYESGAERSRDTDSMAYDLISPIGLERLAKTCRTGEQKYSAYNWEKGMPIRDFLNHAISHVYTYLSGDRSEDHLAHAAWNLFGAIHSEEHWSTLNSEEENKLREVLKDPHTHTVPYQEGFSPNGFYKDNKVQGTPV